MLAEKPGFPMVIFLCGNKEKESHEILRNWLSKLPIKFEIFGREYLTDVDTVVKKFKEMVGQYRASKM